MTRALVIGFGSIGQRHARILRELGCDVAVVSRRSIDGFPCHGDLLAALADQQPDYVVIANETAAHQGVLCALARADFRGRVLVEKPLAADAMVLPDHRFFLVAVAYNLRFHPVIEALCNALRDQDVLSCQIYCGQYLPSWRPDSDYRRSYSAWAEQGGGVLRDLSHEIDYLLWLLGPWRRLSALGGQVSDLDIHSDDCWAILSEHARCAMATLQINYLDRPGRREIVINTRSHTVRADLVRGVLSQDGVEHVFTCGRDDTYRAQHQAILAGDIARLCSLEQANAVMDFIAGAERAVVTKQWEIAP